jgi:hypothetical protein
MPKREPQTKRAAVFDLIIDARSNRPASNASVKRVVRALKTLGVEGDDLVSVLAGLDICRHDNGEPYTTSIKKIW